MALPKILAILLMAALTIATVVAKPGYLGYRYGGYYPYGGYGYGYRYPFYGYGHGYGLYGYPYHGFGHGFGHHGYYL